MKIGDRIDRMDPSCKGWWRLNCGKVLWIGDHTAHVAFDGDTKLIHSVSRTNIRAAMPSEETNA